MKKTTKKASATKKTTKKVAVKKVVAKRAPSKKGPTEQQKRIGSAGKAYTKALHNELAGHTVSYVELEKAKKVAKKAFDKAYSKK